MGIVVRSQGNGPQVGTILPQNPDLQVSQFIFWCPKEWEHYLIGKLIGKLIGIRKFQWFISNFLNRNGFFLRTEKIREGIISR